LQTRFAMEPFIFLVHGTFARNAEWTQKDSKLRRTLGEKLKTDNFEPVSWSGANTTAARRGGVENLRSKLRDSLTTNPSRRHIVIGHSHGGTIALRTVAEFEFVKNVSVILLSTPILIPRKRTLSFRLGYTLAMGTYLSATLGLAVSVALLGNAFPSMPTPPSSPWCKDLNFGSASAAA
jgi:Alpha/beta hydrolase family